MRGAVSTAARRRHARMPAFQRKLLSWYARCKRPLPWRRTRDPYKILVSEIMLQQTQAERVVRKYTQFIRALPSFEALQGASQKKVLLLWHGLGYNRRALALKKISEIVVRKYKNKLPADFEILKTLPGIGKATAGEIAAFAFQKPIPFIETNIRRVFIHFFFKNRRKVHDDEIYALVEKIIDRKNPREWYYALMDYGAMLGKQVENPNRKSAHYVRQSRFKGSNRELRGRIIKILLRKKYCTENGIQKETRRSLKLIRKVFKELEVEGFIELTRHLVRLKT